MTNKNQFPYLHEFGHQNHFRCLMHNNFDIFNHLLCCYFEMCVFLFCFLFVFWWCEDCTKTKYQMFVDTVQFIVTFMLETRQ